MSNEDIIKAWRDEEHRESLDEEQRAELPESPIGPVDLSDGELEGTEGGTNTPILSIVTAVTAFACWSLINGGTCQADTSGCCPPAPVNG